MEHPAASFYRLQMGTTLCWWLLVRKSTGKTVEEVARSEVFTRPAWLPVRLLRVLHAPRVRKGIFLLPLVGLGAGVLSSIGGSAADVAAVSSDGLVGAESPNHTVGT